VDEFDLGRKLSELLSIEELVEGFFFGDVPLDGGVGAGGAYGVAGAFGVDEGEAVVAVELDAVDDVGLFDGDSGDLLLVELGAGGAKRGGYARAVLEGRVECAPGQGVIALARSVSPGFCSLPGDSRAAPGASRSCGEGWLRGCCQEACLDGGVVGSGVGGWVFTIG